MLTLEQLQPHRPLAPAPRTGGGLTETVKEHTPTAADIVTLISFGLGAWWAAGGPAWAALASILGDEMDGRLARAMNTTSERGSALDWGSDIALTTMTLARLGRATGHVEVAVAAAVPILYAQATLRAKGWRPPVLSARALLMLGTMVVEHSRK